MTPFPDTQITRGRYEKGNVVWLKTPCSRCMTKFGTGRVTEVISQQSVQVNKTHHVKNLHSFRASYPLNDEGDTEDSKQPIYLGLGSPNDPSNISGLQTNPDMPNESSSEKEEIQTIPLWRSTRNKRSHLPCHLCDQEISGECGGHDKPESESSNKDSRDLPYCRNKRARLCLEL